jgi:hypothetical protein
MYISIGWQRQGNISPSKQKKGELGKLKLTPRRKRQEMKAKELAVS